MSASKVTKKLGGLLLTALLFGPAMAFADYSALNLTESVSKIGQDMNLLVTISRRFVKHDGDASNDHGVMRLT